MQQRHHQKRKCLKWRYRSSEQAQQKIPAGDVELMKPVYCGTCKCWHIGRR